MFKLTTLPKKPFRNYEEFLENYRKHYGGHRGVLFPCTICKGSGKVHKFEDRDPIEGYKLAPWYDCTQCNGSGSMPESIIRARYKATMGKWKSEYKDAKLRRDSELAALKRARSKLRYDDLRILGLIAEQKRNKGKNNG